MAALNAAADAEVLEAEAEATLFGATQAILGLMVSCYVWSSYTLSSSPLSLPFASTTTEASTTLPLHSSMLPLLLQELDLSSEKPLKATWLIITPFSTTIYYYSWRLAGSS